MGLGPADFSLVQAGRTATITSVQPFDQDIAIPRHRHLAQPSQRKGAVSRAPDATASRVSRARAAESHRITSYNVCYTKLLRSSA